MNVKTELSGESPERIIGEVQVIDLEPVRRWERIIGAWRRGSAQADGENYFLPASKTCIDSHDLRFVGDDVIARVEADVGDRTSGRSGRSGRGLARHKSWVMGGGRRGSRP